MPVSTSNGEKPGLEGELDIDEETGEGVILATPTLTSLRHYEPKVFDKRPKGGDMGSNVAPMAFHCVDRMANAGSGCEIKEQARGLGSITDAVGKASLRDQPTKIQGSRTWAKIVDAHDLSKKIGSLLSHDTHFINGNMQCKQLQIIKPSGLRMPSPSLGFFVQPKSSASNSSSPKAAQPSNIPRSSIPSLQRHKALNSTINPRWRLHAPAKMQKMDNNPTVSGDSMVSGSSAECSVPCVGNDSSHENGKLKLEGNNLLIEELIPCYSKRSELRENQEVNSIVTIDKVFQECGEPHKIYRSSKDYFDSNNEVNIVCLDYRDPSRNDLENTDKTEQINAYGEGYQICQRKNHNYTSNDGILLEERNLFEFQKYESENAANVKS
ncbi:hypothetical protein U1Q18_001885 [Sarracenia purpurea var. burkii]